MIRDVLSRFFSAGTNDSYTPLDITNQERSLALKIRSEFDSDFYLRSNPDVASAGVDPVLHYIKHGASEGRRPTPSFDTRYYRTLFNSLEPAQAFAHYVEVGKQLGLRANFEGDTSFLPTPVPAGDILPGADFIQVFQSSRN